MSNSLSAVLLGAGVGSRMQSDTTKQRIDIMGESVLSRCINAFDTCDCVEEIIVVTRREELNFVKSVCEGKSKVKAVVVGGRSRPISAKLGFLAVSENATHVAIHDVARCLVTHDIIESVYRNAQKYGASTASTTVTDTVKEIDENGFIVRTVERNSLMLMQTPQIFRCEDYKKALLTLQGDEDSVTDDNMLLERIGVKVFCTETGRKNIKITVKDDLDYARFLLSEEKKDV